MLQLSGSITYNAKPFSEFIPQRTAGYVYQSDNHIGQLTTRETLDFSARCQGPGLAAGAFNPRPFTTQPQPKAEITWC